MPKPVLQTRMLGYATDRTGHVMAPQEIVYQCEETPRRPIRNAIDFALGVVTVFFCIYGIIGMPLELIGVDVPSIFDLLG